jgi:hypothetical protein
VLVRNTFPDVWNAYADEFKRIAIIDVSVKNVTEVTVSVRNANV